MNKQDDKYKLLIKLSKHDAFWRMDAEDYPTFMNYICHYFRECNHLPENISHKVIYAEIPEEEVGTVCSFYGVFSPDIDTLLLAELCLGYLNYPREKPFTLHLWVKADEGQFYFIPARMEIK
jgi:hypothetical protein